MRRHPHIRGNPPCSTTNVRTAEKIGGDSSVSRPRESAAFHARTPNEARIVDYLLGGKDNFAADREAAEQAIAVAPELPMMAIESRKFLGRAVRFLTSQGVRQFVDIGCGLPTQNNAHEVAQSADPESRVVYVDIDPVVVTHARAQQAGGRGGHRGKASKSGPAAR